MINTVNVFFLKWILYELVLGWISCGGSTTEIKQQPQLYIN